MSETYTLPQAADICGVKFATLDRWETDEDLVPLVQHNGRVNERRVDERGLLAIGLVKSLRKQGATSEACRPIATFLGGTSLKNIEKRIRRGETILVSSGGQARLVSRDMLAMNRSGATQLLVAVDLDYALRHLRAGLAEREERAVQRIAASN